MKKIIVISGVNFSEGGPLTVIKSLLEFLDSSEFLELYKIIALVHSKELFKSIKNVELIEYPHIKSSWFNRIKFEYLDCIKISKNLNPYLWLSLHDVTPNVLSEKRAVYCHNPSPFSKQDLKDLFQNPIGFLYTKFYKYLYKINIHKNDYVIVQQKWIKDAFIDFFKLDHEKVIIALPTQEINKPNSLGCEGEIFTFFYPALPRRFKNFEVICTAVEILNQQGISNFKVKLTIDGSENDYSKGMFSKFSNFKQIEFVGLLLKEKVDETYSITDCLIFPSKLETWGLPISEFKNYKKPMLVSDLPYAYETVGNYDKVKYFNPNNAEQLANSMLELMENKIEFDKKSKILYEKPLAKNWYELFKILLR